MELHIRRQQIKYIVFVIGDIKISFVVIHHTFRFGDAVIGSEKSRNIAAFADGENLMPFTVAD